MEMCRNDLECGVWYGGLGVGVSLHLCSLIQTSQLWNEVSGMWMCAACPLPGGRPSPNLHARACRELPASQIGATESGMQQRDVVG